MTAIIIDDEFIAGKVLSSLLEVHCKDVVVLEILTDPLVAPERIAVYKPDIIFLDVEMPGLDGFGVLGQINYNETQVIFTTAFHQYALKAIKFNALDYLLKPITEDELILAVGKARTNINKNITLAQQYRALLSGVTAGRQTKLAINHNSAIEYIEIDNIIRLEACRSYTVVHQASKKEIVSSKSISDFEELLVEMFFMRVHKSHLINMNQVNKMITFNGPQIVMENGDLVPLAVRRKELFLENMRKLSRNN